MEVRGLHWGLVQRVPFLLSRLEHQTTYMQARLAQSAGTGDLIAGMELGGKEAYQSAPAAMKSTP